MRRLIVSMLLMVVSFSPLSAAKTKDEMSELGKNTDALYRTGAGARDGAFTSVAVSMLGWGIGLAAGIAILAAALHQSTSTSHAHSHCD